MNLITDPWIPIVNQAGRSRLVGLLEAFQQGDQIADLSVRPSQRVSVMRLLEAIAYSACGAPADVDAWSQMRDGMQPQVEEYLESRHDRFSLFGNRPFLQVANLERKSNAVVDKLDFTRSSGNNDTLYDHGATPQGRIPTDAAIALNLLTYQCYSAGGLIGNVTWAGTSLGRSSEHAPALEGVPCHGILRAETLLDTIHFNLVPQDLLPSELGTAVWDLDINGPQSPAALSLVRTVLGRLVPLSRSILLNEDRRTMTLANGLKYPKLTEGGRDLSASVVVRTSSAGVDEHKYLRVHLDRHPWRDLSSVLVLSRADTGGPLSLRNIYRLRRSGVVDLVTGGLVADRGKLIDEIEWVLSLPLQLIDEPSLAVYQTGVSLADSASRAIRKAAGDYAKAVKAEARPYTDRAVVAFWSSLDQQYGDLVALSETQDSLLPWVALLRKEMLQAYTDSCPHETARQIQAFAVGHRSLVLRIPEELLETVEMTA